ncbi:hypothetical protein AX23_06675 [Brucella melitensis 548]|nr:hypothetical protein AX23_06675 [Brucella melitensis 548]
MNGGPNGGPSGIEPISIIEEMQRSYLDYAMSVIVSRALPDVRDGLKPVHRRILHAMNEMNLAYNRPYRKSAGVLVRSWVSITRMAMLRSMMPSCVWRRIFPCATR